MYIFAEHGREQTIIAKMVLSQPLVSHLVSRFCDAWQWWAVGLGGASLTHQPSGKNVDGG
jgi:hypothetical protein